MMKLLVEIYEEGEKEGVNVDERITKKIKEFQNLLEEATKKLEEEEE